MDDVQYLYDGALGGRDVEVALTLHQQLLFRITHIISHVQGLQPGDYRVIGVFFPVQSSAGAYTHPHIHLDTY